MTEYFTNDFSKEIWETKYQDVQDVTIEDTWLRVATALASVEKDKKKRIKEFYSILEGFAFTPGGRITANAGTERASTTMINCFVDGFAGTDQDSIEGIYSTVMRQAQILKSEGGVGLCCNVMRPRGSSIKGIGSQSPGAIKFLELWDKSSEIITSGSGQPTKKGEKKAIRKGAQMVTCSISHPDVVEFIEAKKTPGRLTKFNMSVLCTDEFMLAVEKDKPWNLIYPDYEAAPDTYKKCWDGNFKKWINSGSPIKVYKIFDSARELWALIMYNTYNRNEPGVLFEDTINRMNNLWYCEYINASNPCLSGDTYILTPKGITQIKNIEIDATIWSKDGWTKVVKKWSTGINNVYKYHTRAGIFLGTSNHFIVSENEKIEVQAADLIDIIPGPFSIKSNLDSQDIMDGLVIGDGSIHEASSNLIYLYIGANDHDYFQSEINELIVKHRPGIDNQAYKINTTITMNELPKTYKRKVPNRFITGPHNKVCGFLRGIYSANGSICNNRITLKGSSKQIIEDVQLMLSSIGIKSYYTVNQPKKVKFKNGEYWCKQSYDLNISTDRNKFIELIGFIQQYKNDKIKIVRSQREKTTYEITEVDFIRTEETFDIEVDNKSHTYWTQGCNVSNCSEQVMPPNASCLLGNLNLTQFINEDHDHWDYKKLEKYIPIAVRFMDNVNDVTNYPLSEQKKEAQRKRRIGLGVTGYGSALMMMKIKYGSKKALVMTAELMEFKANAEYQASVLLAKEKGHFSAFNKDKYLKSKFVQQLSDETRSLIAKHGIRNSHLSSLQPNGNSSVYSNLISGGLEPLFNLGYYRTVIVHHFPENLCVPTVDWINKTYSVAPDSDNQWNWTKEGDEDILIATLNDITYKFDRNRGLTKEILVEDYAVTWLKKNNLWTEKDVVWKTCTTDLKTSDHLNTMKIFAKWVDASISKTINYSNDYPYDDFKNVYMEAWKAGIKGFTTYRAGTMTNVLSTESTKKVIEKRPKELECDVHHLSVQGKPYFVLVGKKDGKAHEVFAGLNGDINTKTTKGKIIRVKKNRYKAILEDGEELCPVNFMNDDAEDALTRLTSTALQAGCDIQTLVQRLERTTGSMTTFTKAIARSLKKYIPDGSKEEGTCPKCGEISLIRTEGCVQCQMCSWTQCI